jgi:hypothetical protein
MRQIVFGWRERMKVELRETAGEEKRKRKKKWVEEGWKLWKTGYQFLGIPSNSSMMGRE